MTFPWSDGSDIAMVPTNWEGTYAEYEASQWVDEVDEVGDGESLSDEDVDRLLRGDLTPLGLTAAAEPHTGAMIALLPVEEDMERLAVSGGEEDEELHLTLCYLGDAAKIPPMTRNRIVDSISHYVQNTPIVDADLFGIATFNEKDGKKDTCVVGLVSGEELAAAKKRICSELEEIMYDSPLGVPEQHTPWIPHITLAYTNDGALTQTLTDREGPVRFDHVRVAFGSEVTDIPLYDGTASSSPVGDETVEEYTEGVTATAVEGVEPVVEIAVTADADGVDIDTELGEYDGGWEGPLMVEDTDTGDQRMFTGGSITWEDPSEIIHPFQWAAANLGAHQGSVTAGRIDQIWRSPENPRVIMGKGRFNLGDPDGLRAFRQVRDGFAGGVSIDPDQVTDADVELEFAIDADASDPFTKPTKTIFHAGRLRGATLVAFPALVEASIRLTKKGETPAVVASVTDEPWKALEHELRLGDGDLDGLVASVAFAYVRECDDVVTRQQCRFLHHEIDDDGQPSKASLVACAMHIEAINAGRAFGLSTTELQDAYHHMAQHFVDAQRTAPAFTLQNTDAVVASIPQVAPLEWFGDPKLSGPTPITVTDDGRVFGHAAAWNSCHTGFADTCVSPPMENDYGYFTTGEVLTAEGHRVAVGQITLGTSHAATRGLSIAKAIDHYGDTGTAVADVTAGTDDHGIWIAGAIRPGATAEHLHALRASALSGDWRRIGGTLRMVALLAVNVPGFPIPRVGTALSAGKQVSLVAAGVIDRSTFTFEDEITQLAGQCGIPSIHPLGKKKKIMYASLDEELVALTAEIKE
jgi:2'-5' RNA ligase